MQTANLEKVHKEGLAQYSLFTAGIESRMSAVAERLDRVQSSVRSISSIAAEAAMAEAVAAEAHLRERDVGAGPLAGVASTSSHKALVERYSHACQAPLHDDQWRLTTSSRQRLWPSGPERILGVAQRQTQRHSRAHEYRHHDQASSVSLTDGGSSHRWSEGPGSGADALLGGGERDADGSVVSGEQHHSPPPSLSARPASRHDLEKLW